MVLTRLRWHGFTPDSVRSMPTAPAAAGTTRRSRTERLRESVSTSPRVPHSTQRRCNSTPSAPPCGCPSCLPTPTSSPTQSPGSHGWPSWPAAWCRPGECRRSSSTRARSPWHGGPPRSTTRSARCSPPSTRPNQHICTAGSGHDTRKIFELMVDGVARSYLFQSGWKADIGRGRNGSTQALRAVFGALAKPDHVVRGGAAEFDLALGQLRDELDRHRRRLSGEPVVIPRVRLLMSHDPHDPWEVRLELVDDTDSMRWCTASDLWDRNDRAIEVAREARHLDTLVSLLNDVVSTDRSRRARPRRPRPRARADGRRARSRNGRGLSSTSHRSSWRKLGVELIGPERLIRKTVRVAGEATRRRRRTIARSSSAATPSSSGSSSWTTRRFPTPSSNAPRRPVRNAVAHRRPLGTDRPRRVAAQTRQATRARADPQPGHAAPAAPARERRRRDRRPHHDSRPHSRRHVRRGRARRRRRR